MKGALRSFSVGCLSCFLLAGICSGQSLSEQDKQILKAARSRYYNLAEHGFQSAMCSISFDFSTVPAVEPAATRPLAAAAHYTLKFAGEGATVDHAFPTGTALEAQEQAGPLTGLLTALVSGVFQTWPTKGLQGPIPPFDSQIHSISATSDGYEIELQVPGGPVRVEMDRNYLVKEMVSNDGKIDEHPQYSPTPEGMVYSGNNATVKQDQGGVSNITYDLNDSEVDGLLLPTAVRLHVNQNIDVKFSLVDCKVQKAVVIRVSPPAVTAAH